MDRHEFVEGGGIYQGILRCGKSGCGLAKNSIIHKSDDGIIEQPDEAVNHPSHYGGDTTYEVIKVITAWELGFNIGNSVKYLARAGKKDPAKEIEDLEKARFYLAYEIDLKTGTREV